MTLRRTHASLAMDRRVHVAMTIPVSSSAWLLRSQLAAGQAHPRVQALHQLLGVSMTLHRTRASPAMEWRVPAETMIRPSFFVWQRRSQLAVAQHQGQDQVQALDQLLGANMMLHRTHVSLAMEWRAPAVILIHLSSFAWRPRSQHVETQALQLLVVVATVPQIAHRTPVAGALPCQSLNAAIPSLACLSVGDYQINAAMQTQPQPSSSDVA